MADFYVIAGCKIQAPNGQYIQVLNDEPGAPLGLSKHVPNDESTQFSIGVSYYQNMIDGRYGWLIAIWHSWKGFVGKYFDTSSRRMRLQLKDYEGNINSTKMTDYFELIYLGDSKVALGNTGNVIFQICDCGDKSMIFGFDRCGEITDNQIFTLEICEGAVYPTKPKNPFYIFVELAKRSRILRNCRRCDFRNEKLKPWVFKVAGIDFSYSYFQGADLTGVDFSGAILRGANFQGANLTSTNFSGANMAHADFTDAILIGTDFSNTDLTMARFSNSPAFSRDKENLTKFINSKLNYDTLKTDWSYLDLTDAKFIKSESAIDLTNLNAEYSILKNINLSDCNLSNANFNNADLTGAELSDAYLKKASFQFAKMTKAVLTGAFMESANLNGAILGGLEENIAANLSYVYLANAKLDKTNLYGVNFSFATFYGSNASCANTLSMEQVDFSNAYLEGINLSNSKLKGAKFNGACLVNVNLSGADLTPTQSGSISTSFAGTCLQGAIFTNTKLKEVNLANSAVSFNKGVISINHYNGYGHLVPPLPDSMPLKFTATTGLDLNTLKQDTTCPNGQTLRGNQEKGISLKEMMISENAPQRWSPAFRFELDSVE